jgi:hypothetical protein
MALFVLVFLCVSLGFCFGWKVFELIWMDGMTEERKGMGLLGILIPSSLVEGPPAERHLLYANANEQGLGKLFSFAAAALDGRLCR